MKISTFSDWAMVLMLAIIIFAWGANVGIGYNERTRHKTVVDLPEEFNQRDSTDSFIIVRQTKDTIVLGFKN